MIAVLVVVVVVVVVVVLVIETLIFGVVHFFSFGATAPIGQTLLIHSVSTSHSTTHHSR